MKMDKEISSELPFGRRSFLKGSAAALGLLATGSAVGCAPKQALVEEVASSKLGPDEVVYQGVCRGGCVGNCPMNVHVREGKIVKTSMIPREESNLERVCQRGLSQPQRVYGRERLQYPMRRVGERGSGEWEQLEWDEAIQYICEKWNGYREQYGDSSIASVAGSADRGIEASYHSRLFGLMGSTTFDNCYDQAYLYNRAVLYGAASKMGPVLNGHKVMRDAKYLFIWGANPTEADTVVWVYMKEAIDRGVKLVVIDPNYTIAASKADVWVPLKPATDAALAMAMINVMVSEGLHDQEALKKGSVAPFLVKASDGKFLRMSDLGVEPTDGDPDPKTGKPVVVDPIVVRSEDGRVGVPDEIEDPVLHGSFTIEGHEVSTAFDLLLERCAEWTPEVASTHCDVPSEMIVELARMYAEGPTSYYDGYGPDHFTNGFGAYQAMRTLVAVSGQYGKKGAGMVGQLNTAVCAPAYGIPKDAKPGPTIAFPRLGDVMETGKYGDQEVVIKSLYVTQTNPLASQIDRKAFMEAFDKIEFIVTVDAIENDTTRYSDVVLPACHYFERTSMTYYISPDMLINEKAAEPLFESKSDFDIVTMLGKEMGFEKYFDIDIEEYLTAAFDNEAAEAAGVTWETMKHDKIVNLTDLTWIGAADHVWGTPTGRFEFYFENPRPNHDYGQEFDVEKVRLPYWEAPLEAWSDNPLAQRYPLNFLSERAKFMVHSTFSRNPWFKEIVHEPILTLNPVDAEARNIKDGDVVKAHNDRGYVVLKAATSAGVRPGSVIMEHGWDGSEFIDGHYSDLTNGEIDPFVCNPYYYNALCEVELVEEGASL